MLVRTLSGPPPARPLPPGTVDAQMHAYQPGFPALPGGPGLPPGALPDAGQYRQVMAWLGIDRVVVTQGNAHQMDNANLLAVLAALGPAARGVAVITADTADAELERLAVAGVVIGVVGTLLWVAAVVAAVVLWRTVAPQVSDTVTQLEQLPAPGDLPSGLPSGPPSGVPTELPPGLPGLGGTEAAGDVTVTSCTGVLGGILTGDLTVTNSSDAASTYLVTLTALDASGQEVGQLGGASESVAPGATAQVQAIGYAEGSTGGAEVDSCRVDSALRSEG